MKRLVKMNKETANKVKEADGTIKISKQEFKNMRFGIRLNKTGKNKGFCIAESKCGAIVQFSYLYNKALNCFEMNIHRCKLINSCTNLIVVNEMCDESDSDSIMYARFNTQKMWNFIKKFTDK